jgi:hypothetical protein
VKTENKKKSAFEQKSLQSSGTRFFDRRKFISYGCKQSACHHRQAFFISAAGIKTPPPLPLPSPVMGAEKKFLRAL